MQSLDETLLLRCSQIVQRQNKSVFLSFLLNNAMLELEGRVRSRSVETGKQMLQVYEQDASNDPDTIGSLCYLQYLAGDLPRCVELLTSEFKRLTTRFQQELKSVFNVKDLEVFLPSRVDV